MSGDDALAGRGRVLRRRTSTRSSGRAARAAAAAARPRRAGADDQHLDSGGGPRRTARRRVRGDQTPLAGAATRPAAPRSSGVVVARTIGSTRRSASATWTSAFGSSGPALTRPAVGRRRCSVPTMSTPFAEQRRGQGVAREPGHRAPVEREGDRPRSVDAGAAAREASSRRHAAGPRSSACRGCRSNQRRQPATWTQRSRHGPFGLSRRNRYVDPLGVAQRVRIGRVGDAGLAAVPELGLVARPAVRARTSIEQHQWATAAAPCSSMSAPVVNRSSANGRLSSCGASLAIVWAMTQPDAGRRLEPAGAPAAVEVQARRPASAR